MPITDLTDRYNTANFMRGGPTAWALDRRQNPVTELIFHHTATPTPAINLSADAEIRLIDNVARYHLGKYGIGPAYNYAVFPSGHQYAIGKYGTHRAHTAGRNAQRIYHNVTGMAIVAFGDYEVDAPSEWLIRGMVAVALDIERYANRGEHIPRYFHGTIPTFNSAGVPYPQQTLCPGRHLSKALIEWGALEDSDQPMESVVLDRGGIAGDIARAQAALAAAQKKLEVK